MTETIEENKITFADLGLSEKTLAWVEKKGYKIPSPIQAAVIPKLLMGDKDILGQAQTGTGKTASFWLPLLDRLDMKKKEVWAMILAPTRELAIQVAEEIKSFSDGKVKIILLYGGQSIRDEIQALRSWPHIVVGTPGRVKDHINKKRLKLEHIDYFILDEADEMLNIGFREEIEEIMEHTPKQKKVLLFSATMPRAILQIAEKYMGEYDLVSIKSKTLSNTSITQKYYDVSPRNKFEALCRIIDAEEEFYSIIFCRTKSDVDDVTSNLVSRGFLAEAIHGDIEQKAREKILKRFKDAKIKILVATDVAARGIDVEDLNFVVNYSLPENPEIYTHRIGRTGRAWKTGTAISFVSRGDTRKLMFIERTIKAKIEKAKLPDTQDIIAGKKKRLTENIATTLEAEKDTEIQNTLDELLTTHAAEDLLYALFKISHGKEFKAETYKDIKEVRDNRASRESDWWSAGRLFVAKGRADRMTPGSLIQFLEKEIGSHLWDVGKIDIFENFSYINVDAEKAEIILAHFKLENKARPLVVQAKPRGWDRGGRSGSGGGYRGGARWWDRGWYRGNRGRSEWSGPRFKRGSKR